MERKEGGRSEADWLNIPDGFNVNIFRRVLHEILFGFSGFLRSCSVLLTSQCKETTVSCPLTLLFSTHLLVFASSTMSASPISHEPVS